MPGGIMELGEQFVDCVVREVKEETGLDVEPVRLIGIYSDPAVNHVTFPNGDQIQIVSATFECRVVGGRPCPDGEESLEVTYYPMDSLPKDLVPPHWIRIEDALAGQEAAFVR